MLDGQERIEELGKNMLDEARSRADEIIKSAQVKAEEIVQKAKEKYKHDEEVEVAQDRHDTDATYSKEISKKDFTIHKTVLAHRNDKVNELFSRVYEKILEFTAANEYVLYLKKLLDRANNEINFYSGCIVYYSKKDEELIKSLVQLESVCDKNIRLGGISVYYPQENLYLDYTLDSAYEKQRKEFVNHSELSL